MVQLAVGGVIFGPVLRDHGFKLNKKVRKLGLKSALSYLMNEKRIKIVKDPSFERPQTSNISSSFKDSGKTTFVYSEETCENFKLSVYNIKNVNLMLLV